MHRLLILLALAGVCLAAQVYDHKKTRPCYMCEYRPPRTWTTKVPVIDWYTYKVSKTVQVCKPKVVYEVKKASRIRYDIKTHTSPAGGFDACKGPLEPTWAIKAGVDTWKCDSNCYVRVDKHKNLARGCYKGETGVDPNNTNDQTVGKYTYRFCKNQLCNYWAAW